MRTTKKVKFTKIDIWFHAIKLTDYNAYHDLKEDMSEQEHVLEKAEKKRDRIRSHSALIVKRNFKKRRLLLLPI